MKLTELQDKLESLQNDLLVISETANAMESSLNAEVLDVKNIGWILFGIARSLNAAVKDVESLIDETIRINSKLREL